MNNGPVFIFSLHRSGGTLLMRLLNCHPDLIIWGEHGGILNQFVEMNNIVHGHKHLNPLAGSTEKMEQFMNNKGEVSNTFAPWASPLNDGTFRQASRNFFLDLFSKNLKPGQRWGFKEIRYFRPEAAALLVDMFPFSQFILLERELVDAAVSTILSPWSIRVAEAQGPLDNEAAKTVIEDVAYGLLAFEQAFNEIAEKFPKRIIRVNYSDLRDDGLQTIKSVAKFLNLKERADVVAEWTGSLSAKLGGTNKSGRPGTTMTPTFIEQHLRQVLPRLRAQFDEEGLEPLIIRPSERRRRHAALLGDHESKDKTYSTIF